MDRCELAKLYHEKGFNCAQAVAAAFCDRTGLREQDMLAVSGGHGGGVGGTHGEMCGALSGAVMVLSLLYPHLQEDDPAGKTALYAIIKDFRARFEAHYGCTGCADLLRTKVEPTGRAAELGVTRHCTLLVIGTVELLEAFLAERDCA